MTALLMLHLFSAGPSLRDIDNSNSIRSPAYSFDLCPFSEFLFNNT